ncbi:MAG: hypothetical protein HQ492_02530 [Woeseiaceae bacterium]|nr:hypothetical protein [Woeseiaceae bacterium]
MSPRLIAWLHIMTDEIPPLSIKLYQISEDDLSELERVLPELLEHAVYVPDAPVRARKQFTRVKEIISNVRWNYGPPREVENIPCDEG